VFSKDILAQMHGTAAIGHVRYSAVSRNQVADVQPFLFQFENSAMSLAHNGNIVNNHLLREELEEKGSIFQSSSSSEVLAHLIKRQRRVSFVESVKAALSQIKGAFSYIILTPNELIAATDPNGIRPLSIGRLGKSFVIASETCAFDAIGASFLQDIPPGEIVTINDSGMTVERYADNPELALCSMEFIYLARPDSDIFGVNVHTARKEMGKTLAKESPIAADVVTAVPDSGVSAAIGYAEEMGLPYELGFIKNRYVARTFIQPSQEMRELGVKMKLSAVRGVVNGKRVVVIDDSIVRGTTIKRIVFLLREAGAKEVHVRIPSPMFKYPSYYGIDVTTADDLIGSSLSKEEICKMIGADTLEYLSVNGVVNSVNMPFDGKYKGLCMSYFTGEQPTELGDYEA